MFVRFSPLHPSRLLSPLPRLLGAAILAVAMWGVPTQAAEVVVSFEASLVPGTCDLDCLGGLGGTLTGTFTYEQVATCPDTPSIARKSRPEISATLSRRKNHRHARRKSNHRRLTIDSDIARAK